MHAVLSRPNLANRQTDKQTRAKHLSPRSEVIKKHFLPKTERLAGYRSGEVIIISQREFVRYLEDVGHLVVIGDTGKIGSCVHRLTSSSCYRLATFLGWHIIAGAVVVFPSIHTSRVYRKQQVWSPGSSDTVCSRLPLMTQVEHFVSRIKKTQRWDVQTMRACDLDLLRWNWCAILHVLCSTLLPILVILRLFVGDLWAIERGRQSVRRDVTAIDRSL